MWTAGHMNIDILNAYCGLYWQVSLMKLYRPHMVEGCIIMQIEFFVYYYNVEVLLYLSVYNILWKHFGRKKPIMHFKKFHIIHSLVFIIIFLHKN
jgi:FlaA1/EpsC-like NDP-sugar epimerase